MDSRDIRADRIACIIFTILVSLALALFVRPAECAEPAAADEVGTTVGTLADGLRRVGSALPGPWGVYLSAGGALLGLAGGLIGGLSRARRAKRAMLSTAAAIELFKWVNPSAWPHLRNLLSRYHDRAGVREIVKAYLKEARSAA